MSILDLLQPKPAEHYKDLTNGGAYSVTLDQDEACVALKIHDYGVDTLTDDEKVVLHAIIGKLKDNIWP